MSIDISKILAMDAENYCWSTGENLEDYFLYGVHLPSHTSSPLLDAFAEKVPSEAKIVLYYKQLFAVASDDYSCQRIKYAGGVALIPKQRGNDNPIKHNNFSKILTGIDVKTYCQAVGRQPGQFQLVGIHAGASTDESSLLHVFSEKIPPEAEVIVGYMPAFAISRSSYSNMVVRSASGVAIIPKKENLNNFV